MFVKLLNDTVIEIDFFGGCGEDLYRTVHDALPPSEQPHLWKMMLIRDTGVEEDWIRPNNEPLELDPLELLFLWVEPCDYQWSYRIADHVMDADNARMAYSAIEVQVRCEGEIVYHTRLYFRSDWRGSGFFQDNEVLYDPITHTIQIHHMDWLHDRWEDILKDADLSMCVKERISTEMRYNYVLSQLMNPKHTEFGICTMYIGDAADR